MEFNNFLKLELDRLFTNIAYKMEAEKMFIEAIKEDKFYHIDDYDNGIKSNLYSVDAKYDAHITLFNLNKIKKLVEDMVYYSINIVVQKKEGSYNILF